LHAKAGEEDQCDGARLDLAVQALERAAHLLAGQVLADIDIETVALEFFGDVAGIVDRLLQRRLGVRIFRVADDQRIALTGCERRGYRRDRKKQCKEQCKADFHNDGSPDHGSPAQTAPMPARAAADHTLRYRHYQTGSAARQPLAMSPLIATINRDRAGRMKRINCTCCIGAAARDLVALSSLIFRYGNDR
jgi:hypothetical protein